MKVLHISTGLTNGGAEAVLTSLVVSDAQNTHSVCSLGDAGFYGEKIKGHDINLHLCNMPRGRVTISGLKKLFRAIKEEKPDVVQTWMYHADLLGGLACKMCGIKKLFWGVHHTTLDRSKTSLQIRTIARLNAAISLVVPKAIIYCSSAGKKVHETKGYNKKISKIAYNGYDTSKFYPSLELRNQARLKLGVSDKVFLLGMVGRWNPQKDHQTFINALSCLVEMNITDWACILVGDSIDQSNTTLVEQVNRLNLRDKVHLLGPRNDIPSLMNAIDLHVLSSAFGEAFPNVVSEAMATGTPCVVTDVGDAAFIVDKFGWVSPPRNEKSLAMNISEAIKLSTKNTKEWDNLRTSCQHRIQHNFNLDKMVQTYINIWQGS